MSRWEDRQRKREEELGRKLRARFPSALPVPPDPDEDIEVPYAKRYEHDFDEGEAIAWLIGQPEWEQTIGAACDEVEAERPARGPRPSYTTRELEIALFYQVMRGIRTWKAARKELAGDTGQRARAALGFDAQRATRCPQEVSRRVGVPSEATMSRHRARFPYARRLVAYRAYFDRLRKVNAQDPELRKGMRILGIDGTAQATSFTCPVIHPSTGLIDNPKRVTAPEGGYRPKGDARDHGWAATPLHCINGLPWAYAHDKVNVSERDLAARALEDFRDNVMPYTGPRRLGVLTADQAFHDQKVLRPLAHSLGLVPNIHHISHAKGRDSTGREKEEAGAFEFDLEGKPGWYADGYRELHHRCGTEKKDKHPVHTFRRVEQGADGRAITRLEARCSRCNATVSITAGQWRSARDNSRRTKDPRGTQRFVKVHPTDPEHAREWDLGNPLTYNDTLAGRFGNMRFGHGEGFNGATVKRFKLFKTKGYLRTTAQAELHCVMVFALMHGLTHRRRELEAAGQFKHADQRPRRRGWSKKTDAAPVALAA